MLSQTSSKGTSGAFGGGKGISRHLSLLPLSLASFRVAIWELAWRPRLRLLLEPHGVPSLRPFAVANALWLPSSFFSTLIIGCALRSVAQQTRRGEGTVYEGSQGAHSAMCIETIERRKPSNIVAFPNNDVPPVTCSFDHKIDDCLGFPPRRWQHSGPCNRTSLVGFPPVLKRPTAKTSWGSVQFP